MYSAPDLPREGLPHSDIRGSTIARISPRLIAACHVLHRLLVPRHPLNALLILISSPPARRTKPHSKARFVLSCPIGQQRNTETLTPDKEVSLARHSISPNQIHDVKQRGTPRALLPAVGFSWNSSFLLEAIGFEPTTPCLQSRRSPAELRPHGMTRPAVSWPVACSDRGLGHVWAREDLNLRPHAYQACALTN